MRSKADVVVNPEIIWDVGANAALVMSAVAKLINMDATVDSTYKKDGHWWTCHSMRFWGKQIWYLTESQIRTAFKKLIEKGYLIAGCYNDAVYDRTTWYTFGPKGEEIYLLDKKKA